MHKTSSAEERSDAGLRNVLDRGQMDHECHPTEATKAACQGCL